VLKTDVGNENVKIIDTFWKKVEARSLFMDNDLFLLLILIIFAANNNKSGL